MTHLRLQRYIGCLWMTVGTPEDAGDDPDDAESQALHWLAEIYSGSYPVDWPGPYQVEISGQGMLPAIVNMNHPKFLGYCEEESEAETDRAREAHYGFMRD